MAGYRFSLFSTIDYFEIARIKTVTSTRDWRDNKTMNPSTRLCGSEVVSLSFVLGYRRRYPPQPLE